MRNRSAIRLQSSAWRLLISGGLLALPAPSVARETIRIAVGDFPPYLTEKQPQLGVAAQIIREAFAAEDIQVEFVFLPWARAYTETRKGRYDATGVWLKKPDREPYFFYSAPLIKEKHVFFHLKNHPFTWSTPGDLHGLNIGGILGFSYGSAMDQAEASGLIRLDRINTDAQNFKKLLAGRIHIYPQEINVGYSSLHAQFSTEDIQRVTHHPTPFLETENFLLFPRNLVRSPALLAKFDAGLKRINHNVKVHAIFDH